MHNVSSFFSGAATVVGHVANGVASASGEELAISAGAIALYSGIAMYGNQRLSTSRSTFAKGFHVVMIGSSVVAGCIAVGFSSFYFLRKDCLSMLANAIPFNKDSICYNILTKSIVCICRKGG
jgi:hypothetical protein